MPLENGRADERVSKGQASERAVCVYEVVSVERGARCHPLPAAVVCPAGGRRRQHLARTSIYYTAKLCNQFFLGVCSITQGAGGLRT
jgi:hypothetical protein